MPDEDEVRIWLQGLNADYQGTNPFAALRSFREANPGKPIPTILEFVALYADIVGEGDQPENYEAELLRDIDKLFDNDDAAYNDGKFSAERINLFERIDELRADAPPNLLEIAAAKALDELHNDDDGDGIAPDNDPLGNLIRAYHRYHRKRLIREVGDAIASGDEPGGIDLLGQYLRRSKSTRKRF